MAQRLKCDAGHPTWQAEIHSLCHRMRKILLAHPGWMSLLSRPGPPISLALRERLLALMTNDGMLPEDAMRAVSSASLLSLRLTLVELAFRKSLGDSTLASGFEQLKHLSGETSCARESSMTLDDFARLHQFDLSENFERAVASFLSGLDVTPLRRTA